MMSPAPVTLGETAFFTYILDLSGAGYSGWKCHNTYGSVIILNYE
jgi:hypothetical protein